MGLTARLLCPADRGTSNLLRLATSRSGGMRNSQSSRPSLDARLKSRTLQSTKRCFFRRLAYRSASKIAATFYVAGSATPVPEIITPTFPDSPRIACCTKQTRRGWTGKAQWEKCTELASSDILTTVHRFWPLKQPAPSAPASSRTSRGFSSEVSDSQQVDLMFKTVLEGDLTKQGSKEGRGTTQVIRSLQCGQRCARF